MTQTASYSQRHKDTYTDTGVTSLSKTKTNIIITIMAYLYLHYHSPKLLISLLVKIIMGILAAPIILFLKTYISEEYNVGIAILLLSVIRGLLIVFLRYRKLTRDKERTRDVIWDFVGCGASVGVMLIFRHYVIPPTSLLLPYLELGLSSILTVCLTIPVAESIYQLTNGRIPPASIIERLKSFRNTGDLKSITNEESHENV